MNIELDMILDSSMIYVITKPQQSTIFETVCLCFVIMVLKANRFKGMITSTRNTMDRNSLNDVRAVYNTKMNI